MPAHYPLRYRATPHTTEQREAYAAERLQLLELAGSIDAEQRQLSNRLAEVRTRLAELRVVLWPRVDPRDIVRGFRQTRVNGPPAIPPVAPNALVVGGKHLRYIC